jgi:hypothetical protein
MRRRAFIAGGVALTLSLATPALLRPRTPLDVLSDHGIRLAPSEPFQGRTGRSAFEHRGHRVTPVASFDLEALVLSRRNYGRDRGAEVSPVDLALGWGPMSNPRILSGIPIRQSGRWYRFRIHTLPRISAREVHRNSSNMHIIPSDGIVSDALDEVRDGDVIRMSGLLVDVAGRDGFRWKSSRSRNDTGNGACELVYAETLRIG